MRLRTLLIVACALLCGGTAAVGVNLLVGNPNANREMETVVVATAEIARGQTITAELVEARPFPKSLLPAGVVTKLDDVVGRAAFSPLIKDEPVLDGKLAPKGAGRGLASLIPKGMRAITIQTPNVSTGVAGFILPGSKVDVLMTLNETGNAADRLANSTFTLLENIEILAVDQKVDAPAENKVDANLLRSVTLLVSPQQATKLSLAQSKGTLHLALRNPTDGQPSSSTSSTMSDLKNGGRGPSWDERLKLVIAEWGKVLERKRAADAKAAAAAAAAKPRTRPHWTIRTVRGTHEGTVRIDPHAIGGYASQPE